METALLGGGVGGNGALGSGGVDRGSPNSEVSKSGEKPCGRSFSVGGCYDISTGIEVNDHKSEPL